jgi:quercetin dioxygenase-like cupin family protein
METGTSFTQLDLDTDERFVGLRRALGVSTFGFNQLTLAPGQRGRIHRHDHQEEVYLVISGRLTLSIEAGEHQLSAGEMARVAPQVRRQLVNRGPDRCVVVALGGAHQHDGRDGRAFTSWDEREGRPPQEVPMPADLSPGELRG